MTISVERWLGSAVADVRARGLEGAVPVLEAFARGMTTLRAADWNTSPAHPASTGVDDGGRSSGSPEAGEEAADMPVNAARGLAAPLASDDLHTLDIALASERLRHRTLTSLALTEHCLQQIDTLNPELNAFITITRDEALAAARTADEEIARGEWRGPLHGIPISLKDLIDQQGLATTAGSRVLDRTEATRDAPVTAALRRAGAVLIGKTNLHEFAFGTTSDESAFGPVRHPVDRDRSPGGSSGGSAVAVATGMSLASIGTDTGGSIRIPAAACGVVGLKPGFGELSCSGIVPLSGTLDHVGPLARTVRDATLVYGALASGRPQMPATRPVRGLRIGLLREYFEDLLEDDVRRVLVDVQQRLRAAGASLSDVRLPHAPEMASVYLGIVFAEAAAYHAAAMESRSDRYQPGVRLRLEAARFVLAEDYLRAMRGREAIRTEIDCALDACDVLMAPTLPIEPPPIGAGAVTIGGTAQPVRNVMLRLTQPFNVSGHPAVTLPAGRTSRGFSCGVQLIGRRGGTMQLLAAALACESLPLTVDR
jgi:aspartyl-tRNA(Asn)/glutamyl-tRNA(Gln) amidotransferase subunit A